MSGSIKGQITRLFKEAKSDGSRHTAKRRMRAKGIKPQSMTPEIFSWGTFKRELNAAQGFGEWAKTRYGIKEVSQFTADMVREYMAMLRASERMPNTLTAILVGLKRLDKLARARKWLTSSIIPPDVKAPRQKSWRGAYTLEQAHTIIDYIRLRDPRATAVLEVMLAAGLRLSEALTVSKQSFPAEYVREPHKMKPAMDLVRGTVTVQGKGGKRREVEMLDRTPFEAFSDKVKFPLRDAAKHMKEQAAHIQALVRRACQELEFKERGTHGFRALAARCKLEALRNAGYTEDSARAMVAKWLGHGEQRRDVVGAYLFDS